jgi:CheY-like chemotaxis protein
MSPRITLLVEDYAPFREVISSMLQQRSEFQVVEARDGVEAIQTARELQPDLVVIDIGLPKLNGIDAAIHIRKVAPRANLLFLSQESDADIVEEAFRHGARAYVHKHYVLDHLLPAIEVVLWGNQFVSGGLDFKGGHGLHSHAVQFYSTDSGFVNNSAPFVANALRTADAVIVIATKSHGEGLARRLTAQSVNIDRATQEGKYLSMDLAATLSAIMVNGIPDPAMVSATFGGVLESVAKRAGKENPQVAILGECSGVLFAEGKTREAIHLERIGNPGWPYKLDVLCSYALPHDWATDAAFKNICAEHSAVYWH